MTAAAVEKLVWTLIYGGLLLACLGVFLSRDNDPVGWTLAGTGAAAVAAGVLLIWLRSRMRNPDHGDTTKTTTAMAGLPSTPTSAAPAARTKTSRRDTTR